MTFFMLVYAGMFLVAASLAKTTEVARIVAGLSGRIGALDGFRGVLALGVFVHHSVTSYVWMTTGIWNYGPNAVLNQLGQTGVALFFMITGFLFTKKSLSPTINWPRFYTERLARLGPLYALLVFAVFAIVLYASGGELYESVPAVGKELVLWLAFVAFGRPDVNRYPETWHIIAGVNWSLQYEVIFYVFAVPGLYAMSRLLKPVKALGMSLSIIGGFIFLYWSTHHAYVDLMYAIHFLVGISVAYAYAIPASRRTLQSTEMRWAGAAAALCLFFMIDNRSVKAMAASAVIFTSIVGGASLFGLLKTRAAIWLGDISYGIYLLHGLMLWLGYRMIRVPMSLAAFTAFVMAAGTVAVLIATSSYVRLELPVMAAARRRRKPSTMASQDAI